MNHSESGIIRLHHVSKKYGKGKVYVPALTDINTNIKQGEFVSIVGKSGSGKSTLLNLIGGLDTLSSGKIIFGDRNLADMSRTEMAEHRKFSVGMIFQSFNLIRSRNAVENVSLALAFGGVPMKHRNPKSIEILTTVGLGHRLEHYPSELSGGEAQRVAIARALANNPKVILADEPTGNLDTQTSTEIMQLLLNLNEKYGKTILMVTHDIETAEATSNRIIRLKDGKQTNNL